jgi:ApaG protein
MVERSRVDKSDTKRPASSDTVTEGIRVQAAAQYMPSESNPSDRQYIYAYRIILSNEGTRRAKLKSRHWIILDADNHREDVRGPGVVGKTPDLAPGERFEYMSGCPLRTSWGTMEGSYIFERESGEQFEALIGRFFLVPTAPKIVSSAK